MSIRRLLPIASVLLLATAPFLHAQVLLIVNESNPNLITITATGAVPENSDTDSFFNGIDLLNFYTSDASYTGASAPSSTLTTGVASTGIYDTVYSDTVYSDTVTPSDSGAYLDLNLYSGSSSDNETFTSNTPGPGVAAFTGAITYTAVTSPYHLPTPGLTGLDGTVIAGYSGDDYVTIGTYDVVIPEPGTWALLLGGLACLFGIQRFRKLA
jgi:hypothetical protein